MALEQKRCALCRVRDHALGGRSSAGAFMLALPIATSTGAVTWPRLGTNGWCGDPDDEVQRLIIVRITLTATTLNGKPALLCQHCLRSHQAGQGVFADLFSSAT